MENDNKDNQKLIISITDKYFEYKKGYNEQKDHPLVKKWKYDILKKYGKGGQFYYCKFDGLYYYADKEEAIYNKACPKCNRFFCPFCNYLNTNEYGNCCIKQRIRYLFLFDMYFYFSPKTESDRKLLTQLKPNFHNLIPFLSMCRLVAALSILFFWRLERIKNGERIGVYEYNISYERFFIGLNVCFGFFISIP